MFILPKSLKKSCFSQNTLQKSLASTVLLSLLLGNTLVFANTVSTKNIDNNSIQIRGGISIGTNGNTEIPSLSLRDADIQDVLYSLAQQAGFNLIVDKSVKGTISLDLKNISINKLLEYIMTLENLTYYKDGKTVIITSDGAHKDLNKLILKSVPVKYSDAQDLADVLNKTVFSIERPGGNSKAIATADLRTNSILIMGNEEDIALANRALAQLDFPLQHKTFFLKNAAAVDVANVISQTLFSVSLSSVGSAGGSSSSGSSSSSSSSSTPGSGTSGSSSAGSGTALNVRVLKGGPMTFIANTGNNTLTLIGSAEQIKMAESMLYDVDVKPAQVAIQVSILQLTLGDNKTLGIDINNGLSSQYGVNMQGKYGGLNFGPSATSVFWDKTGAASVGLAKSMLSSIGIQSSMIISKSKLLANPTVIAVSGTSSTIDVTNDVLAGVQTTASTTSSLITETPIIKQAGIQLSITPQVMNDGTVSLQLSPTVSSPGPTVTLNSGNGATNSITLMSSNNLSIADARVKDGQTLVLGGLIKESNDSSIPQKIPFLSDIPFVGRLFRAGQTTNNTARTELVILVTPHIIKEDGVPYFRKEWRDSLSYDEAHNYGQNNDSSTENGIVPTSDNAEKQNPKALQTIENRQGDTPKGLGISPVRYSNLPLQTFSEVLK